MRRAFLGFVGAVVTVANAATMTASSAQVDNEGSGCTSYLEIGTSATCFPDYEALWNYCLAHVDETFDCVLSANDNSCEVTTDTSGTSRMVVCQMKKRPGGGD